MLTLKTRWHLYINSFSHETENTQWDHPEMIEILDEIGELIPTSIFVNV